MSVSPTSSLGIARRRVVTWLVRLLAVLALLLALGGRAEAGPLEESVGLLEQEEAATAELVLERSRLEAEHQALGAQIEALKADGNLVDDYALQDALRRARTSAEALNALSERIRAQREREADLRRGVVAQYDALISRLEAKLLEVPADQQAALISNLEALQLAREDFRRALNVSTDPFVAVAIPDLERIDGSDPEELLAAADELADNEEKLRGQLDELESRIDALERRRRLVAFAEDSADEADLFGEEARSTRVRSSRSDGGSEVKTGTDTSAPPQSDQEPTSSPTTGVPDGGLGEPDPAASPEDDGDDLMPAPASPDQFNSGVLDGDTANEGRGSPPRLDDRNGAPTSPELGGAPALPPASNGGTAPTVIRSDADPGVIAGGGGGRSGGDLDSELRRLKSQRKKLERDIDRVNQKQSELRERAGTF